MVRSTTRPLWTIAVLIAGLIVSQAAGVAIFSANRFQPESGCSDRMSPDRIAAAVRLTEDNAAVDRAPSAVCARCSWFHVGWGAKPLVD